MSKRQPKPTPATPETAGHPDATPIDNLPAVLQSPHQPVVIINRAAQTPLSSLEDMLTTGQAARLLNVAAVTIYRWVQTGELPAVRVGRQCRIKRSDLEAMVRPYLAPGRREAVPAPAPNRNGSRKIREQLMKAGLL